jgi:peptidyl-prolyl cis-trans isomerase-like 4
MDLLISLVDEDLHLIFSRFGKILSCEVIRDKRTGDSLQYAFIEFENQKDCEQAYFKMQGVLIDDHRIHVDFSQSVMIPPTQCFISVTYFKLRSPSSQIVGELRQTRSGQSKAVDLVVYPVWRRNATTGPQKYLDSKTLMEWSLIKRIWARGEAMLDPVSLLI